MKEASIWQRYDASSTEEVTHDTSSTGTHKLYPRLVEEQRAADYHEEERDRSSASAPGPCDDEEVSTPGDESIQIVAIADLVDDVSCLLLLPSLARHP